MTEMTHEYSNFPDKIFDRTDYQDMDDDTSMIANQIKDLKSKGLYGQAQKIIEQHYGKLKKRVIDAEAINAISEELRNLEIYSKQIQQSVFMQNDEPICVCVDDVWIGD